MSDFVFIPVKPRLRRRRHESPSAPPAPVGLLITSVVPGSEPSSLIITFSASIVWNGVDVPNEFMAFTEDGFMDGVTNVLSAAGNSMEVEFNNNVIFESPWEVTGAMSGITPEVAYPQSGTVMP